LLLFFFFSLFLRSLPFILSFLLSLLSIKYKYYFMEVPAIRPSFNLSGDRIIWLEDFHGFYSVLPGKFRENASYYATVVFSAYIPVRCPFYYWKMYSCRVSYWQRR
jgi:hypothetical protein